MNTGYNISFTIASVVIVFILILIMALNYSSANLVNKRFRYFLYAAMAMFVLNIATVYTNAIAAKLPDAFNYFFNSAYFFSTVLVSVLFFYYCASFAFKGVSNKTKRIFLIANLSGVMLYLIALIVNCFTGWYFYFDYAAELPYAHGWFFLPINLYSLIFVVESIAVFVIRRKGFNTRQIICTGLFFALFFLAYGLQLLAFPNVLLSDFGCAIGALLVFFSIETPDYAKLIATLKELHELKGSLEEQVAARTEELKLEKASYEILTLETLSALADLVDAKDHYTNGHSFRVAAYAKGMAVQLGLSQSEAEQIYLAGLIHDVGKVAVPISIIRKPGKLTEEEFETIKSHPRIGGDILRGIKEFPYFEQVAHYHHERYDGKGYPGGLKGDEIPYYARIVTVCDCFDAMTSDRSYRKALSDEVALKELVDCKGTQFDPALVDAFLELYNSYGDSIRNHVEELSITTKYAGSAGISESIKLR